MELTPGAPDEVGLAGERIQRLAALGERWFADGDVLGVVMLVARHGRIVLHRACGRLSPAPAAPPLPRDALFRLASLSKPITATAAVILVEDGLLGLGRPVAEYIPEFVGPNKDQVLVGDLLTHTSGLRDEDVIAYLERLRADGRSGRAGAEQPPVGLEKAPWAVCLSATFAVPLRTPPDVEMVYCSYGYDLLGEIISRVSGQSLADFARQRIFRPLGMDDTFYRYPAAAAPRIAQPPLEGPRAAFLSAIDTVPGPLGSGTVYATALDMAIFAQTFLNEGTYGGERILSLPSVAAMTRNQIPGISAHWRGQFFREASWGLGWNVVGQKRSLRYGSLWSPRAYCHGGMGSNLVWVDPTYDLIGVCFSTVCRGMPDDEPDWRGDLFANAVMAAVVAP